MDNQTLQGFTNLDYLIQSSSNLNIGMKETDIDILKSSVFSGIPKRPKKQYYYDKPLPFEIREKIILGTSEKKDIFTRITEIINKLIEEDETFKGLDKKKVEDFLQIIEKNIPSEQLEILSDKELFERVKNALEIELMCGLLSDLTDEQIIAFESAIKRRNLFK